MAYNPGKIIEDGIARRELLFDNIYLHNFNEHFEEITQYESMNFNGLDAVLAQLTKVQEERERKVYGAAKVKNIEELADKYFGEKASEEYLEAIGKLDTELIENSISNVLNGNFKLRASGKNRSQFKQEVEDILGQYSEDIDKEYKNVVVKKFLNKGLNQSLIQEIDSVEKNIGKSTLMKNYGKRIEKPLDDYFSNQIELSAIGSFINSLKRMKGAKITADKNISDTIKDSINFQSEFNSKVVNLVGTNNIKNLNTSIQDGQTLRAILDRMKMDASIVNRVFSIEQYINFFNNGQFKYNLVNYAVQNANFNSSQPAIDILNIIKTFSILYFAAQLTENISGIKNDFIILKNNTIIPISFLLKRLNSFKTNPKLTSDADVEMDTMYNRKVQVPMTNGYFYEDAEIEIGGYYGQQVFDQITVTDMKISAILNSIATMLK